MATVGERDSRRLYFDLFLLSVVMLYLELLLIRWISAEVRIFAYFKNFTLIACFLGMGFGCSIAERRRIPLAATYPLLLLLCAVVSVPGWIDPSLLSKLSALLGDFNEMATWTWGISGAYPAWLRGVALLTVILLFSLVVLIFVPLGCALGAMMTAASHKIAAYSVNVGGSLLGVWLYSAVAHLALPPVVWFSAALLLGCLLLPANRQLALGLGCTVLAGSLLWWKPDAEATTLWSPYQKLSYRPLRLEKRDGSVVPAGLLLQVNQTFYQRAVNLDKEYLSAHPDLFPETPEIDYMAYNLVYRLQPKLGNVLVVGAGTGNDVAAALRNGARNVDAVEIDPLIAGIGRDLHPERPYGDPRVDVIVDDARSFLKKTDKKYDLIVFGALDSHTLNSSLSNIRIDNYVYTVESFREAREALSEEGLVSLVFAVEQPFIAERLYGMLRESFGRPPLAFRNSQIRLLGGAGGGPTFLIDRSGQVEQRVEADPRARQAIHASRLSLKGDVPLATDDWPYLYLEGRKVPRLYLIVMAIIIGLSGILLKPLLGGFRRIHPHFFFLGAGFLLIEVQSISKIALLFGTTWTVNSIVISAVLVMVLLGNLSAATLRIRSLTGLYAALAASLVLNYVFPFEILLPLPSAAKALLGGGLMSLPIYFASLIFILSFARTPNSAGALGSNLFGAIVGGMCESGSFVVGINALGLMALAFYAGSLWRLRRSGGLRIGARLA